MPKRQDPIETTEPHRYTELGRRIQAAVVSYQMGLVGIDYTLKKLPEGKCAPGYAELGEELMKAASQAMARSMGKKPSETVQ